MENIDVSVTCDALYDININTPISTSITASVTNNHCINKFFQILILMIYLQIII